MLVYGLLTQTSGSFDALANANASASHSFAIYCETAAGCRATLGEYRAFAQTLLAMFVRAKALRS